MSKVHRFRKNECAYKLLVGYVISSHGLNFRIFTEKMLSGQ
jgi:hypothetical protein